MKVIQPDFIWFVRHRRYGELILIVQPSNNFARGWLYSTQIIAERLRPVWDKVYGLELCIGPLGFIPRKYYEEAGFAVELPKSLRILIAACHSHDELVDKRCDKEIKKWVIDQWNKTMIPIKL
jgi:hypothetical protein